MKVLCLTLGHNSSAILVEDGNIICGYEEERLSGVKSNSNFPVQAILRLQNLYDLPKNIPICVGHWFLDGQLPDNDRKHWRPDFIKEQFPKSETLSHHKDFTHHDAHKFSAEVFVGDDFPEDQHTFVVDGFGTDGECFSIYEGSALIARHYGFYKSIGLFYQYATAYCGMKMHQHEYKMLGYETHLNELIPCPYRVQALNHLIDEFSSGSSIAVNDKLETELKSLGSIQDHITHVLDTYMDYVRYDKLIIGDIKSEYVKKVLISYFAQRHTENVLRYLFRSINPTNLVCVGGVFFNVKVNSMLCDMTSGRFSVMPLAGDQGAGLGVYQYYFKNLKWPNHLFWGKRDIITLSNEITFGGINIVSKELSTKGIVNWVRGGMEFGPRSLTHTSTLALPFMDNVNLINKMNDRTTIMPLALVVTEGQMQTLFEDTDKVHRSLEYMIMTRRFKKGLHVGLEGGAHKYPLTDEWTCRPQVTYDLEMVKLLEEFGPLINTSANVHNQPIVYNQEQIEYMTKFQRKTFPITTVIGG